MRHHAHHVHPHAGGCRWRRSDDHHRDGPHGRLGHRRGGPGWNGRPFDYGELRLVVLALIAEQPRHGYELIRGIEERMGGSYSPSPGVIYPTLSWLEDMGYASVEQESTGRKRYSLTPEGQAFLDVNKAAVDDVLRRIGADGGSGRFEGVPAPVIRAMENLKLALRLRLRSGPLEPDVAERIAAALDEAAQAVERGR